MDGTKFSDARLLKPARPELGRAVTAFHGDWQITFQFIVEAGESVKDVILASKAPPREFIGACVESLLNSSFAPAMYGGAAIPFLVEKSQRLSFSVRP